MCVCVVHSFVRGAGSIYTKGMDYTHTHTCKYSNMPTEHILTVDVETLGLTLMLQIHWTGILNTLNQISPDSLEVKAHSYFIHSSHLTIALWPQPLGNKLIPYTPLLRSIRKRLTHADTLTANLLRSYMTYQWEWSQQDTLGTGLYGFPLALKLAGHLTMEWTTHTHIHANTAICQLNTFLL